MTAEVTTGSAPKALLVHAHSEKDSFVTAMRDRIEQSLLREGYQIEHSDLYADQFNSVLSPADFGKRSNPERLVYAIEQRHGHATGTLAPDILFEIAKVERADLLVFTFPLFWFGLPAIMKGWIDRVFVSGLFYGGKTIYARGGMAGKKATAAFSLGGREDMFGENGLHGPLVDGFLRSFFQGTLGYVGMEVIEPFVAYHAPYLTDPERDAVLDKLDERFSSLTTVPRISLPDLSLFGSRFEPIPNTDQAS